MAVLTTPTTQTVYGSIIDQANFQKSGVYSTTTPAVYLTRILARMMGAAHSPNSVLSGLDVISTSGLNTQTVTFTLSPGSMIIDSDIVHFPTTTTISTDLIPLVSPSKLRVGIFASYSFNASSATTVSNKVSFTSYLFDMNDNLIAPALFGGSEKILVTSFIIDMEGVNLAPLMRISSWSGLTNGTVQYIGNGLELTNTGTVGAEISRTITGLVIGVAYRVRMEGYGATQVLIGSTIGSGILLTATGMIDATFVATAITTVITLRVNSIIAGVSAKFIGVKLIVDNYHNARTISPSNSKASGGNLKALSTNNPSKTIMTEISVVGHGTFRVKGDSRLSSNIDFGVLDAIGSSVASWVIDVPKMKPTSTALAYNITEILL